MWQSLCYYSCLIVPPLPLICSILSDVDSETPVWVTVLILLTQHRRWHSVRSRVGLTRLEAWLCHFLASTWTNHGSPSRPSSLMWK